MRRYPIDLFLEEVPADGREPAGQQLYQVVAYVKADGATWYLTRQHRSDEEAMDELRSKLLDAPSRAQLVGLERAVQRDLRRVGDRLRSVEVWADRVGDYLTGIYTSLQSVTRRVKNVVEFSASVPRRAYEPLAYASDCADAIEDGCDYGPTDTEAPRPDRVD